MDLAENVILDQEIRNSSEVTFDLCAVALYFYDVKTAN